MSTRLFWFMAHSIGPRGPASVKNALTSCDHVVNGAWVAGAGENHVGMAPTATSITASPDELALERGELRVEIALSPFAFTVLRAGRRLLRSASVWVADGVVRDQFIQFTEGVLAREERRPA